ncbi:arylsulfatase [Chitinophaga sp. MM2321]|uniref:arylsulfatase n=1 Tax=Chitinophaga sp. MM2321 TaxID=3137178 RepID=UPI0032D579B1
MKVIRKIFISAGMFVCWNSGSVAYAQHEPLPQYQGTIGKTLQDTKQWWPEKVKAPAGAPNVVWIVIDDLGFGATSTFGGLVETPNLDKLANGGLRYANFHTTAICAPTRAALVTGRNSHSVHFGMHPELGIGTPGYDGYMPFEKATVAEILRENGYNTFAVGKWHLTSPSDITPAGPFNRWPTGRGFDHYYGFIPGATDQYHPLLWEDTHKLGDDPQGKLLTTLLTDKAITYIAEQKSAAPEKPFFLYYTPGATHQPHQAPKEWIDKYKGKFDGGWDKYREQVLQNQIKAGLIPAGTQLPPRNPGVKAWNELNPATRKLYARFMEVYAGYLSQTDFEIGRLINYLEQIGQLDNTLVFVLVGDNGASQEGTQVGYVKQNNEDITDEQRLQKNIENIGIIGTAEANTNYPLGWSMAANTPFRYYKRYANSEGGTHNPLIVRYPKLIKEPGGIRQQYSHVTDILPTTIELTGVKVPEKINGYEQAPFEGTSFAYSISDKEAPSRHTIQYYEISGARSIYKDGWKACAFHKAGTDFSTDIWTLYHLAEDVNERIDLAPQYPDKLKQLQEAFDEEATKYNVFPLHERLPGSTRSSYYGREHVVLYPGISTVTHGPGFNKTSFSITADVVLPASGAEGVLLANGGRSGGFSLFVKNRKLYFAYNTGDKVFEINTGDAALPSGHVKLKAAHTYDKENGNGIALFINDRQVSALKTGHAALASSYEGLEVGRDISTPVSTQYAVPFAFTGTINQVDIDFR